MHFGGVLTAALFGVVIGASGAVAQNYAPAETPPASFKGRQYVDSTGCVFVRAGYGDATKWVPRINRDRTAVCGYKPSLAAAELAKAAPVPKTVAPSAAPPAGAAPKMAAGQTPRMSAPAAKPSAHSTGAPMATVASNMMPETRHSTSPYSPVKTLAPRAVAQSAPARTQAPVAGSAMTPRRYASPYSVTADQKTPPVAPVTGARAPVAVPVASTSVCADLDPVAQAYMQPGKGRAVRCGPQDELFAPSPRGQVVAVRPVARQIPREVSLGGLVPVVTTSPAPEGGWKPAFDDGRLNPYRGPRTQAGDAQMAQHWNTRKTPMEMRAAPGQVIYAPVARARVSTKSVAPAHTRTHQPVVSGKRFVQVGSYGVPDNAEAAKARLRALGLPVATGRAGRLTVIYAGPFNAPSALQEALISARRAGFTDALLR